ncbi:MAG TPA: hypothetical protein VHQ98_06110 [Gaiellaceae bacterium]|nr:hypothetical protein [Gaiellaceae bacterium]
MNKSILTLLVSLTLAALAVAVPVATAGQSQQGTIRETLGEIGAWAVPSPTQLTSSKPVTGQSQQAIIRVKLGEIGAWAVPSPTQITSSKPVTGQSQQAIIREKLAEIGAWAVPSGSTGPVASSGDGFDWNAAGFGAALAFGTMLVGAAGVVTVRRYHGPLAH